MSCCIKCSAHSHSTLNIVTLIFFREKKVFFSYVQPTEKIHKNGLKKLKGDLKHKNVQDTHTHRAKCHSGKMYYLSCCSFSCLDLMSG